MKKTSLYIIMCFAAISLIFSSCEEDNAPMQKRAFACFRFMSSQRHTPLKFTAPLTVTATAYVNGPDTVEVIKDQGDLDQLMLPLSFSDSTVYAIHYPRIEGAAKGVVDTICVRHQPVPYVGKIDWGMMMFYNVESISYSSNALDSIKIVNRNINNEEKVNFNIYYTVAE